MFFAIVCGFAPTSAAVIHRVSGLVQKSVDVDMTAATKADVKSIHLYSCGGSVDFSLLEGYPNPGFTPKIFMVDGHIDERISCFLSDNLLQMTINENRKIQDLSFLEKAPHLQMLNLYNLSGITTLPFSKLPQLSVLSISGLHKLTDMESLAQSNVQYLNIKLSADKAKKLIDGKYDGKTVVLGIRPEDVYDSEAYIQNAKCVFESTIKVYELLGAEVYLYFDLAEFPITARVDSHTTARPGDTVKFAFDVEKIHVFDKETEQVITN